MSLQYGFNYLGWEGEPGSTQWKARYEQLSEEDKKFYHNVLPWAMMALGLGHLSKETIPVFVNRNERLDMVDKEHSDPKYLERFIGFECNVNTETDREWIDHHFKPRIPVVTANPKLLEAEFDRYLAEVHGIPDKMKHLRALRTH